MPASNTDSAQADALQPVPYRPAYEALEDDEAQTTQELVDTMRRISETVAADEGRAYRSVHAKPHGIVRGTLQVLPLPATLAHGLFAQPASYPVTMRLSSTPGDLVDDAVSTPRGLALKIFEVHGDRLDPSDGLREQDFVMINGPVFNAATAKQFLKSLKLLAATTDKAPNAKKLLSAALRALDAVAEKVGVDSATLKALGGHPATHPLGETYFTQVPQLLGPYMAKFSLVPVTSSLIALKDAPVDISDDSNALRAAVLDYFSSQSGEWELRAQLCVDVQRMPIEDATTEWPQELSPYLPVARIRVAPQSTWQGSTSEQEDDQLAFSPWRGLQAHRPIGSIMRVRRAAYAMTAAFRQQFNAHKS